jgi:hypothetical protein
VRSQPSLLSHLQIGAFWSLVQLRAQLGGERSTELVARAKHSDLGRSSKLDSLQILRRRGGADAVCIAEAATRRPVKPVCSVR